MKDNLCKIAVFVPYRGLDIPSGQVDRTGFLVTREVRTMCLVQTTDQWNNWSPWTMSIMCLPWQVWQILLGIHLITLSVCCPGRSLDHVGNLSLLGKEVPRTFYQVSKTEKPLTVWCGDGGFSPFRQLVIHPGDLIVHCPSGGVANVLGNHVSTCVGVGMNSWHLIVRSE